MFAARAEGDEVWRVVPQACRANISDGAMVAVLWQLVSTGMVTAQNWRCGRGRAAWSPSATRWAGAGCRQRRAPWRRGEEAPGSLEAALRRLEHTAPAIETDAVVRLIALQVLAVWQQLRDSPQEANRQLGEVLGVLPEGSEERLPVWLRRFCVDITSGWTSALGPGLPRYQELRAARRRMLGMPADAAEAFLEDFDTTELARERASQTGLDLL